MLQDHVQRDQPPGVLPLSLTGERTLPDVPAENYWYRRHLAVYEWIAARCAGLDVVDMACGEGYGTQVLARRAARVVGVDANPEAHEHASARYARPGVRFERELIETFAEPCDVVVFLQTIEHVEDPEAVLGHLRAMLRPGGTAYVSTPNVLTLAPPGAERSDNPWHVREYRPEQFRALCEACFPAVEMHGVFHARRLRLHDLALRAGWDRAACRPGDHRPVLRLVHALDLRAGLRAARGCARPGRRSRSRAGARLPRGAELMPGAAAGDRGTLCLLLHAHMPYVEGFGTWPFGEEWLWEAVATVYLPLIHALRGRPVTVGLTPVLCDQLELLDGPAGERFLTFMRDVRAEIHAEDAAGFDRAGEPLLAGELRRAAGDYATAERSFEELGGDLVGAFRRLADEGPVELWAGPATHPILPLLATDAGRRLQLAGGLAAHERRFGRLGGGLWLPECAYEPGLERDLAEFGVRAFCVDQTDAAGLGSLDHLEPVATAAGVVAVPIDWDTVSLVWDQSSGYPTGGHYRDRHRRTVHDLKPWSNAGDPYDHDRALALAREDARDFVGRAVARLDAYRAERGRPGLLTCALDAELLGHWWYEGPAWLRAVLDEAPRQGLELATLPAALDAAAPVHRDLAPSSWGLPKDLTTWDAPPVAELAFRARAAELELVAAAREAVLRGQAAAANGPGVPDGSGESQDGERGATGALARAARELLALQSSDWAFMESRALAADYPSERVRGHSRALDEALRALRDSRAAVPASELRNLAPALDLAPLLAP